MILVDDGSGAVDSLNSQTLYIDPSQLANGDLSNMVLMTNDGVALPAQSVSQETATAVATAQQQQQEEQQAVKEVAAPPAAAAAAQPTEVPAAPAQAEAAAPQPQQ